MRFSWFSRRAERRRRGSAARRRASAAPLAVRRLERRRVLDASIMSVVVPSIVAEGDTVSSSATGTGTGTLSFEWSVKQGFDTIATGSGPAFDFVAPDDGTYEVVLELFDSDQTSDSETHTLIVTNVEPTIELLEVTTPIDENGTATLSGTYSDPGLLDTHELDIDWNGDNVYDQTVTVSGGSFSIDHQFRDDDPTATPSDTHNIFARLRDDDGGVGTAAVQLTVDNVAPQIANLDATDANENGATTLTGEIVDLGTQDTFTLEVDWGDGTIETFTYGAGTTDFSETHQYFDDDPSDTTSDLYTIQVTLTDDDTGANGAATTITVANVAPSFGQDLSATNVNEKGTTTLSGSIVDPGTQDTFTLQVDWGDGAVETFTYGAGTTSFSETHQYLDDNPTATASDPYVISVKLVDDDGGEDTGAVLITVTNVAPTITGLAATDVAENGVTNLTGNIVDPGTQDTFTLEVNWGDGVIETFTYAAGTTSFGESHQYLDDDPTGTASDATTISVKLVDDDTGEFSDEVTITISNVAPAIENLAATNVDENGTSMLTGNIVDPGTQDTFTLEVNWGDGVVETFTYAAGATSFNESHQYLDDGPAGTVSDARTISVKLVDDDTGMDSDAVTIAISNVAPAIENLAATNVDENGTSMLTGNIVDPGTQDTFTLEVNWGDGVIETFTYAAGTTSFSESHQYLDDNPTETASDPYTISVKLVDDDTGMDTDAVAITVSNVAPVLAVVSDQVSDEGALVDLSGTGGAPSLATFTDIGTLDTHTATINWGDGTATEAGAIVEGNGSGSVGGSHTYADDGTYTVTVTLTDDDGGVHAQTFDVMVNNVAPTLTVVGPQLVDEGSLLAISNLGTIADPGFNNPANPNGASVETFTYFIQWGDGTAAETAGATIDDIGGVMDATDGSFDGGHTFADNGTYTVTVRVADDDMSGNFASGVAGIDFVEMTISVTVNNVAPTLSIVGDQTVDEGAELSITNLGVITDPGFDNPNNPLSPGGSVETFTYTINWGDGTASDGGSATIDDVGGVMDLTDASFDGSHTYADNGTYTVVVRVADDDMTGGEFVEMTFVVTVNNVDPTLSDTTVEVNEGETFVLSSDSDAGTLDLGVLLEDPGFDNPLNAGNASNGGETEETFTGMTIDWGDGTAIDALAIDPAARISGSPGVLTTAQLDHAAHTYADNGSYTVEITFQDDDGPVVTRELTIVVNNVAPNLDVVETQTRNEAEGLVLVDLGTISDPGFDNPLNPLSQPGGSQETFEFSIDWGDGTTTSAGDATIDDIGAVGDPTDASFDGSHVYSDNGAYTVVVRVADDDMSGNFATGIAGVDFVETTFTVVVANVAPQFEPLDGMPFQEGDDRFEGTDVTAEGFTTIRVAFSDPGFDNPLNAGNGANGGETAETFTYLVNWGDGATDTIEVVFVAPGVPLVVNTQTSVLASLRAPGDASTRTTGEFEVTHRYNGPPNPQNPTAPITITLTVMDDDGGEVTADVEVRNPGIETVNVAIDTTPDVPRLDSTPPPPVGVFIVSQTTSTDGRQTLDVAVASGEMVAAAERFLELRVVYPDGTESEGYRLKDEVLLDLRQLFASLPDGRYKIYLVRTENNSRRLVMEVDVRNGRVIDTSDDSEGTRDRPPTSEATPEAGAVPLDENPLLEQVPQEPGEPNDAAPPKGERATVEGSAAAAEDVSVPYVAASPGISGEVLSERARILSGRATRWAAPLVGLGVTTAAASWSSRVNQALADADDDAWKRLRRAGRLGGIFRRSRSKN